MQKKSLLSFLENTAHGEVLHDAEANFFAKPWY